MINRGKECVCEHCKDNYTHIVYWPGKNPPPRYCEKHAKKAIKTGDAMGLVIYWKKIEEEVE